MFLAKREMSGIGLTRCTMNKKQTHFPCFQTSSPRIGIKKDLLLMLSQKNTKEEQEFLKKLIKFMERRNTPIERPPMLGFKQSTLVSTFYLFILLLYL